LARRNVARELEGLSERAAVCRRLFLIAWFGCRDDRRNVRRGRGEIETRRVA